MKGFLITLGVVCLMAFFVLTWWFKTSNAEIRLSNKISGQQEMTEAYYTKLWEILKSKAGVTSEYAEKFKAIQVGIMEGRYSTGGEMMKWIQEANPEFDSGLYKDLMNSIEGERNGFFVEQQKLRDMKVQHDNMIQTFPSSIVVGNRPLIEVIILKNRLTKEAYSTGTDSLPSLY